MDQRNQLAFLVGKKRSLQSLGLTRLFQVSERRKKGFRGDFVFFYFLASETTTTVDGPQGLSAACLPALVPFLFLAPQRTVKLAGHEGPSCSPSEAMMSSTGATLVSILGSYLAAFSA